MRRQGGGFGIVMLLVVVAVVLYLATKAWKNTLPTAAEIARPGGENTPGSGEAPPLRPSLREMKQETEAHTSDVSSALDQAQ